MYILYNYNFTIEPRRSEQMPHVDFLSREGCSGEPEDYEIKEGEEFPDFAIASIIQQGNLDDINWKQAQDNDEPLKLIRTWKENGNLPPSQELKQTHPNAQKYAKLFDSIAIDPRDNILVLASAPFEHPEIDSKRILVPKALEQQVVRRFHKNPTEGHFAEAKTMDKILNHFWMISPSTAVKQYIAKCLQCQLKKKSIINKIKPQRGIVFTNITDKPMSLIYMDHYGPLPKTPNNNEFILTIRDNFTRYVWLVPVPDTKTDTVIKALESHIFKYFGLPDI